ncbi:MAG: GAF domain-containing protein [Blastocatellia bacterium]|nr:GAF domain-containing protein [Blastocatellia bacterium]
MRAFLKKLCSFFVCLGVAAFLPASLGSPLLALDPHKALTQYSQSNWQDELPQSSVLTLTQTRDGYIWLGTWEGLVRFDGVTFTVFSSRNVPEMQVNGVWTLYEDRKGALWVGTFGGGLLQYWQGKFKAFTTEQGLASNIIRAILEDRQGNLWVGTEQGLSCRLPEGRFASFTSKHGLSNDSILALSESTPGVLWVGTTNGLNRFEHQHFESAQDPEKLRNSYISALFTDRQGRLWVGSETGVWVQEQNQWRLYGPTEGLTPGTVLKIAQDRDDNLWVGTEGGLNRLNGTGLTAMTVREGLPDNAVQALCEDHEGSLWIGTNGGLCRLRTTAFTTYTTQQGLPNNFVRTVLEDRQGRIWVGTDGGGLACLAQGSITTYGTKEGLPSNLVKALWEDQSGTLWIGTTGGGLCRLKDGAMTTFTVRDGLSNDNIRAIFEDSRHRLWVGTHLGVSCLTDGKWTTYTTRNGLSNDYVFAFCEDRQGAIWAGTINGLTCFQADGLRSYTKTNGLTDNAVLALHADAEGNLWIGTSDGGLNRFRDGTFRAYTVRQGMPDNKSFHILEDRQGQLWLSSNRGVYKVRKSDLDALDRGIINQLPYELFDRADGLPTNQCSGSSQPAAWRGRDGRLWFATIRGVAVFDPGSIRHNLLPPPVTISQVVVDGQVALLREKQTFLAGVERFEFHYAGLSFLSPDKVRFKFRLNGFDSSWNEVGTRRTAYYTNLPPGTYEFQVLACNNDGVWNEVGATFRFELLPPWWKTWWASFLLVLLLGGIGFGGVSWRIQSLKRHQRQRLETIRHIQEQRISALRQLLESIQIINSQLALATVLQAIAEESARLVTGLPGGIGFVEDTQIVFRRIWLDGWQDAEYRIPVGMGISGRVVTLGVAKIVNDIQTEDDVAFRETLVGFGIAGFLQVPILSRKGRVVGVLMVRRPVERPPFTKSDCQLVESLANQAAVAIENARLYGELAEKRDELEAKNIMIGESLRELERLYQNEQAVTSTLHQLNQMKTNFMIVTSHEMRTPLAVLKGYHDTLVEGYFGELNPEQKQSLEACQRMVDRMAASFEAMLEMIKINAGQFSIEPLASDVAALVRSIPVEFRQGLAERKQRVSLDVPDTLVCAVDRDKLRMALTNILQNAIKFSPDAGEIRVRARLENNTLRIAVQDFGIGIEPTELERIFEYFYTGSDPNSHTSGQFEFLARGNGLGLSIARSYIEAHGGRIWAESAGTDQGSCFYIEIPQVGLGVSLSQGRIPENKVFSR